MTHPSIQYAESVLSGDIYALTEPLTGEIRYIGQTTESLKTRLRRHINEGKSSKKRCYRLNWVKKLITQNTKPKIILLERAPINKLADREIYYIKKYKELNFRLVNSCDGGKGGMRNASFETREKISMANKGKKNGMYGKKHTPETILKYKKDRGGKKHPLYGKKLSEDTKRKISLKHKGMTYGSETRRKVGEAMKGRPVLDKTRKKLSLAFAGEKSHFAKLTWKEVRLARMEYSMGDTTKARLARKYSVSKCAMGRILNNKAWIE